MQQIEKPMTEFLSHVPISRTQRRLLNRLLDAEGNIVTHEQLIRLWDKPSKTALEIAIFNLRKKIHRNGYKIISHRGLGYSLVETRRRKEATDMKESER